MNQNILICCVLLVGLQKVNAQLLHINDLDSLWHFKVSATGLYTDGNSPRSLLTNKLKLTKLYHTIGLLSNFTYQYGTASAKKINTYNDYRIENIFLLYPKSTFVPFVRWFTEKNLLRKIDFRNEISTGVIYKVVNKKNQAINLFIAGAYQQTNYEGNTFNHIDNNGSHSLTTWEGLAGIAGSNTLVKDKLTAEYRLLGMQSFHEKLDYSLFADITLDFKLSKRFSILANGFYTYENIEQTGVVPYEVQFTYGLSLTF